MPAAEGIDALVAEAKASDTFRGAPTVDYSDDNTVAEVVIPTAGDGSDAASVDALTRSAIDLVPATVGKIPGVEANVTGDAAEPDGFQGPAAEPAAPDLRLRASRSRSC